MESRLQKQNQKEHLRLKGLDTWSDSEGDEPSGSSIVGSSDATTSQVGALIMRLLSFYKQHEYRWAVAAFPKTKWGRNRNLLFLLDAISWALMAQSLKWRALLLPSFLFGRSI
jgi:hypothetical protein